MNLNESVAKLQTLIPNLKANDAKFASDLIRSFKKFGGLTPKQAPWIERLILRAQVLPANPAPVWPAVSAPVVPVEAPVAVNVGGFEGVIALFNQAKAHLKFPKITLLCAGKQIKLAVLGQKSKNAGSVNITDGGKYPYAIWYGRVSPEGVLTPSAKLDAEFLSALTTLLQEFSKNPARVAKEHGRLTGSCCFCNKTLGLGEDKRSVAVGFGPVCADHYGLKKEWLAGAAKAEAAAEVAAIPLSVEDEIKQALGGIVVEAQSNLAKLAKLNDNPVEETVYDAPVLVDESVLGDTIKTVTPLLTVSPAAQAVIDNIAAGLEAKIIAGEQALVDEAVATLEAEQAALLPPTETCFFCEKDTINFKKLHGFNVCLECVGQLQ